MAQVRLTQITSAYSRGPRGGALLKSSEYGAGSTVSVAQAVMALVIVDGAERATREFVNEVLHHGGRTGKYVLSEDLRDPLDQRPTREAPNGRHAVNW